MRASLTLVLLAALLLASSFVSARNAKHFKPGPYAAAVVEEYRQGAIRNALIPANAPQQVLTSLSGVDGTITVTWVTFTETGSTVQWGHKSGSYDNTDTGASFDFVDPEGPHTVRVMHTAHMSGLKPHTLVYYRVGDQDATVWSDELQFVAPPSGDEPLSLVIYGDLGLLNAQSMDYVKAEVASGEADMVLHVGDYAYDLHTENGTYGDTFLNNLQPIASRVPYLGVQGNHEGKWNATHFRNRFTAYEDLGAQSGSGTNWWFSWEYVSGGARVHFVAINSEMYYDYVIPGVTPPDYSEQRAAQYAWLDRDLAMARDSADWVIVYGHRPMYCSDVDSLGDCTSDAQVLREGYVYNSTTPPQYGMDDMIATHNVDMYFTAHEHSYERTLPVWRGYIDQQQNHTHTNPRYPVHIVTGSAGCQEYLEWFDNVFVPAWSVVRSPTYGYGHLIVHNATHLYWDQLLDEGRGGRDWLWIERNATRRGQPMMDLEVENSRAQKLLLQQDRQELAEEMTSDQ